MRFAPTRVLLVAQPMDAGVPRHVLDIVEELKLDSNFTLTVACPVGSTLWDRLDGCAQVNRRPFTARRAPHPADVLWILRLLPLLRGSDVVHAHSSKAAWLVRAAALLTGRRSSCVVTPHAWCFWAFTGWRRRALVALERLAAHACGVIIAVSQHERDEGLRLRVGRSSQYRVIRNGVDLQRWSGVRRPERDLVLMVGRLAPQKRPQLAVRALAMARKHRPGIRLVVAGGGELHDDVQTLATQLGVGEATHLLGDRDDVPDLLGRAACVLITSEYEGCSLAVLEAMAAGVPVVAARFGGIDELVEDGVTGLVCDESAQSLAAGLVFLCGDGAMASEMGEQARRRARDLHSRQRMVAGVVAVYQSCSPAGEVELIGTQSAVPTTATVAVPSVDISGTPSTREAVTNSAPTV